MTLRKLVLAAVAAASLSASFNVVAGFICTRVYQCKVIEGADGRLHQVCGYWNVCVNHS